MSQENPLLHYLSQGWLQGLKPKEGFDSDFYVQNYPEVARSKQNPLVHYVVHGQRAGFLTSRPIMDNRKKRIYSSRFQDGEQDRSRDIYRSLEEATAESLRRSPSAPELIEFSDETAVKAIQSVSFITQQFPEITIVIPVYNSLTYLAECLVSIAEHVQVPSEILVADDCSTDGRIRTLLENHQSIKYIRNQSNVGFLQNANNAIYQSKGKYILLLNSDVQLTDDCASSLMRNLKDDPHAKIAGPKFIYPSGRLQEAGCSVQTDCSTLQIGLGKDPDDSQFSYNRYVDYISGACICFRKSDFLSIGKFNTNYSPAYYEDVELCTRFLQNGGKILYVSGTTVVHHLSVSSELQSNTFKLYNSAKNKLKFQAEHIRFHSGNNRIKPVAFYLPQFHSIRQNSYWWGEGYTEWRAVASASPNFKNHYQPHIPADLGFYDLSSGTAIFEKQARLARRYGLHGFCFYYYNFGDSELLERPLELFCKSSADINFCLCWANESWTRNWDGKDNNILYEQQFDATQEPLRIVRMMERFIHDPRYMAVDGKPLLLIYRAELINDIQKMAQAWRNYWREKYKTDLYLCLVDSMERSSGASRPPEELGFDAAVEFPVHNVVVRSSLKLLEQPENLVNASFCGQLIDYEKAVAEICSRPHPGYKRFPGVFPSWDNTPRVGKSSTVFKNVHPSSFQFYLEMKCKEAQCYSMDERLLFINAWNEWGEGAHLEPDIDYGHTWLQVVEKVVKEH